MLESISPELAKIGEVCQDLHTKIEESQVEDGDPPFAINHDQFLLLRHCERMFGEIIASTVVRGETVGGLVVTPEEQAFEKKLS